MKRFSLRLLVLAAAGALFAALVYAVLLATRLAEPAPDPVRGPTVQRVWATSSAGLALLAVVVGALAIARPGSRFDRRSTRVGAMAAGMIAAVNGGLVLALADGGPGTGNGVVGAAAAVVLGLTAVLTIGLALKRSSSSR